MKKLAFALIGVVTALSTACASGINSNQAVDDSANISDAVSVDTALEPTIEGPTPQVVDWDGRWSGVIPCATCPGIDVDLTFNKDGTFWMKEKHVFEQSYIIEEKNQVVHGFMDLVIYKKDEVIIVDFKTDATDNEKKLIDLYAIQLQTYKKAMKKLTNLPINTYIYSFSLSKCIYLE